MGEGGGSVSLCCVRACCPMNAEYVCICLCRILNLRIELFQDVLSVTYKIHVLESLSILPGYGFCTQVICICFSLNFSVIPILLTDCSSRIFNELMNSSEIVFEDE